MSERMPEEWHCKCRFGARQKRKLNTAQVLKCDVCGAKAPNVKDGMNVQR